MQIWNFEKNPIYSLELHEVLQPLEVGSILAPFQEGDHVSTHNIGFTEIYEAGWYFLSYLKQ